MTSLRARRHASPTSLRIAVLGTLASDPYAGMAWMQMQIAAGFHRLGHDVRYFEVTSAWPYDPTRQARVGDSDYAVPYLTRVSDAFGLGDRWAYRRSYADGAWFGLPRLDAEDFLATADVTFNISGATRLRTREQLKTPRLVYLGTDPVFHEIAFARRDKIAMRIVEQHDDVVTYGENIGRPDCPIPALPRLRTRTRQPILLDLWRNDAVPRLEFTTVCNWRQSGHDVEYGGEVYHWSKHHEFLKVIDLPRHTTSPLELAMGLADATFISPGFGEPTPAAGLTKEERALLLSNGWRLVDAHAFTTDPWPYRDYIIASRGEFTVAKDQNVRLRSGWFSERSACYLAAGRPVITQDTGFGTILPTGQGLFAFTTIRDVLDALDAIATDYGRHCRAARSIAEEYFRAETVLARLLSDLGH